MIRQMRSNEEIIEDVLAEEDEEPDPSIPEVIVGSWREALGADGIERVVLVGIVALLTVVMPVLFVLSVLEMVGLI